VRSEPGRRHQDCWSQGKLVAEATDMEIRVVTLNFLAKGGDGYPFDKLGQDVEHTELGEQKALADYLSQHYKDKPYDEADTKASADKRIMNLAAE
jgi:hypothetical protein